MLYLVLAERGGVGKSVCARIISDMLIDGVRKVSLIDADAGVGVLSRYFGARDARGRIRDEQPVIGGVSEVDFRAGARKGQVIMTALDATYTAGAEDIVVDTPGGAITTLKEVDAEIGLFAWLADESRPVTVIMPIRAEHSSMLDISDALGVIPASARLVVVRVASDGDRSDAWARWEGSKTRLDALARGATEIELPFLSYGLMGILDERCARFSAASKNGELDLLNRRRLQIWWQNTAARFASVLAE